MDNLYHIKMAQKDYFCNFVVLQVNYGEEIYNCGSTVPTLTNSARISACRQASNQRGDDLAKRLADDATTFWCHKNCISIYCSPHHIQKLLNKRKEESDKSDSSGCSSKSIRSSTKGSFNFREHFVILWRGMSNHTSSQESKQMERGLFLQNN